MKSATTIKRATMNGKIVKELKKTLKRTLIEDIIAHGELQDFIRIVDENEPKAKATDKFRNQNALAERFADMINDLANARFEMWVEQNIDEHHDLEWKS